MIVRPHYMELLKTYRDLQENANTDLYVTGSNSKLMSSEILTCSTVW